MDLVVFEVTIDEPYGLHLRPACRMISIVKKYKSCVKIKYQNEEITVSQLSDLLKLGVDQGERVTLSVAGPNENETAEAICKCLSPAGKFQIY